MPACPRSEIIDENEVGTYHIYSRCVRKAFLLGKTKKERREYFHRKEWIRNLLIELAALFAIDVLKYGVLDNHFHLMLRNRPDVVMRWNDEKLLRRALKLFQKKFEKLGLYVPPDENLPAALLENKELIAELRRRFSSISWFMKILKERVAKWANREDNMTGTFWDGGRFRSVALLDEAAVAACAFYIDLNLIRAGVCSTPEESQYTSAYDRIQGLRARRTKRNKKLGREADGFLVPLNTRGDYPDEDLANDGLRATNDGILELPLPKYLETLDQLGRMLREGKRGSIPQHLASILERLGINPELVLECIDSFRLVGRKAVGSVVRLRERAERMGRRWLHGVSKAKKYFFQVPSVDSAEQEESRE